MTIKDCLLAQRESSCVTTAPPLKTVTELKISDAYRTEPTFPYVPPHCVEGTAEVEVTTSDGWDEFFSEGEKPKVLLASMCYTKVGRKKKKQIKKQLKKQFGEQARGETFKSLLKKQFWKHFTQLEFGRPYNINPLKGVKATLIGRPCMSAKERLDMAVEAEIFRNELNRHTIYIDDIPTDVRAYMAGKDNDGTVN